MMLVAGASSGIQAAGGKVSITAGESRGGAHAGELILSGGVGQSTGGGSVSLSSGTGVTSSGRVSITSAAAASSSGSDGDAPA